MKIFCAFNIVLIMCLILAVDAKAQGKGITGVRNSVQKLKEKIENKNSNVKTKTAVKAKPKRIRIRMTPDSMEAPLVLLWPGAEGAPAAKGNTDRDKPAIYVYLPKKEKQTGAAVVIYPGGGYGVLAMDHEGKLIAQWMNQLGIAAFVTRYRLGPTYNHPVPLQDAQRAVRYVRANAGKWNLDKNKVGIIGFSAGGHLASTVGTHFDFGNKQASDPIDQQSSRPDFMILGYPVISMQDEVTHKGSRRNLLGKTPDPHLVELLSNERQVTKETPETFIFQTNEDKAVKAENSLQFALALRKAGVSVELHLYERGRHGLGMSTNFPGASSWPKHCEKWLQHRKLANQ